MCPYTEGDHDGEQYNPVCRWVVELGANSIDKDSTHCNLDIHKELSLVHDMTIDALVS